METLAEKAERSDQYTLRSVGFCDLRLTLSAALSLEQCSRRTSDSQGVECVVRACLEDKGQGYQSGAESISSTDSIKT